MSNTNKLGKSKKSRKRGSSLLLRIAAKMFINSRASVVRRTHSFANSKASAVEQAQPIGRLFGFFSTGLNPQQEVLFAHRLVRLDVIGTHRAGGANKLLDIFEILYRSRKPFHEASRFLREQERPLLQIVRSFIRWLLVFLHFLDSSSNCFGFRRFEFRIFITMITRRKFFSGTAALLGASALAQRIAGGTKLLAAQNPGTPSPAGR